MAEKIMGYCVKHKGKIEMKDPKLVTFPNGRKAWKGKCPKDGTTMVRAASKEESAKLKEKK